MQHEFRICRNLTQTASMLHLYNYPICHKLAAYTSFIYKLSNTLVRRTNFPGKFKFPPEIDTAHLSSTNYSYLKTRKQKSQ